MFSAYIIYSEKLNKHYVGSAEDVDKRLKAHNGGRSRFTSRGIPWVLVREEKFNTRSEAYRREKEIKSYKSGIKFKKLMMSWRGARVA